MTPSRPRRTSSSSPEVTSVRPFPPASLLLSTHSADAHLSLSISLSVFARVARRTRLDRAQHPPRPAALCQARVYRRRALSPVSSSPSIPLLHVASSSVPAPLLSYHALCRLASARARRRTRRCSERPERSSASRSLASSNSIVSRRVHVEQDSSESKLLTQAPSEKQQTKLLGYMCTLRSAHNASKSSMV